jgi:thioredoxin 1
MTEPTRDQVDALPGPTLLEFGASWCGYCQAAQPLISEVLRELQHVRHVMIEDGKGKRLGRSFGVKLWPTLVFMLDGSEVARLVRPGSVAEIKRAMEKIATPHREAVIAARLG